MAALLPLARAKRLCARAEALYRDTGDARGEAEAEVGSLAGA